MPLPDRTRIGTAGWSIPAAYTTQFPLEGTQLTRYATRLDAVEINSSFYRPHRRTTYERWAAGVPPDFRFAVKLPKTVTHEHRLVGCDDLVARFFDEVGGLGAKLAVVLVQLPPSLAWSREAADFLATLAGRSAVALACEPRHRSWFTPPAEAVMAAHGIARVAADPARVEGADRPGGSPRLVYVRLHGSPRTYYSDYDAAALDRIRARLEAYAADGRPVWCIFDNTAAFHALGNALAVAR